MKELTNCFYVLLFTIFFAACSSNSHIDNSQNLNGNSTISANTAVEVVAIDLNNALPATGSGFSAIGTPASPDSDIASLASQSTQLSSGGLGATGVGLSAGSIVSSSMIDISSTYSGSETLDYCSLNSPFQSVACIVGADILLIRQELIDGMGSDNTASISIKVGKSGYVSKTSNVIELSVTKHKITQISNIISGPVSDDIWGLTVFNGTLYFIAYNETTGSKLYSYDGNTITQISNINDSAGDDPENPIVFNGALYFGAYNNSIAGYKLYSYDGVGTITQVSNINDGGDDQIYNPAVVFNGDLYFTAYNGTTGDKLYRYDGVNPITQVTDINVIGGGDNISSLTVFDGTLYFDANNGTTGDKLYSYDDVSNTVTQISDIAAGGGGDQVSNLTVFNDSLYFTASSDPSMGYQKLYSYDGENTITQISNINDGLNDQPSELVVFNDALYFIAINNPDLRYFKLYKYDGTNITQISNIIDGGNDFNSSGYQPVVFNGALYFTAFSATNVEASVSNGPQSMGFPLKLYRYDGTKITQISDINKNLMDKPSYLTVFGGSLYFTANKNNSAGVPYTKLYKFE